MMRSVWAVVAGFLFIMVLSLGTDAIMNTMWPKFFNANGGTSNVVILCLTIVYVGVFAVVGSYITARLAPSQPMKHALILGVTGLAFTVAATTRLWNTEPAWYNILNVLLVMPYAWFGGRLRENELGGSAPVPSNAAMA